VAALVLSTTGAAAATDLHSLLSAPTGADWVDVGSLPTNLVGDFTAHDYAGFLQANGTSPGQTEFDLNLYGYTRGYGLEWQQRGTNDVLVERVFEFRDSRGAAYLYSSFKRGSQTATQYDRDIAVPASLPNSFGAVLNASDGSFQYRVEFEKGNLVFVVHMDSNQNDLSAAAVTQAAVEYDGAPSQTQVPPGAGQAVNNWLRNIGIAAGALVVAVAIVITITIVLITRRNRPAVFVAGGPAIPSGGPMMSADGAYWWDGQRWRDASVEAPATAPRSPDGAHWWDGRAWRALPPHPPPG
jgi:hypothetical protein